MPYFILSLVGDVWVRQWANDVFLEEAEGFLF